MKKKVRIPLLKDHHSHPVLYAAMASYPDIRDVKDKQKALSIIAGGTKKLNVVLGWNDSFYDITEKEIEDYPATLIFNTSLHGSVKNTKARDLLSTMKPSGVAGPVIADEFSILTGGCTSNDLILFYRELSQKCGVWFAEEMVLVEDREVSLFEEAKLSNRTSLWADLDSYEMLGDESRKKIKGLKVFTDGALGTRSAALSEPYLGGELGELTLTDSQLISSMEKIVETGKSVAIHAIGDLAILQVVCVLEQMGESIRSIPEIRMEHAQFVTLDLARRLKDLGVVLSMQPNFSIESKTYRDRLPEKYVRENNNFRMLIDGAGFIPGRDLILGSDGMPHGAGNALTSCLYPPLKSQILTLDEFVAGYCMPDLEHGYLVLSIDNDKKQVSFEVMLAE